MKYKYLFAALFTPLFAHSQKNINNKQYADTITSTAPIADYNYISPGKLLFDNNGHIVNAHSAGLLYYNGTYYWFGEHKSERSVAAVVGVTVYSSKDLYNWKNEGVALSVSNDEKSPIVKGCIIERPKVIYNEKTKTFVMYFHLELRGQHYDAALAGMATAKNVTGPYTFLKASRVNAGHWPINVFQKQKDMVYDSIYYKDKSAPGWREALVQGLYLKRDIEGGQMSRDMNLFVDDDKKAYHIYSSEENFTLQIAELTDDYLDYTGRYIRVAPGGSNEAPAMFKKDGKYFMFTSGTTGWAPNAARLLTSDSIMGEWTQHPNPCVGEGAELTFRSQSTFVLPVQGKKNAFIFMADRWTPENPIDSRYVWLPVKFKDGMPYLEWTDRWKLDIFDNPKQIFSKPE